MCSRRKTWPQHGAVSAHVSEGTCGGLRLTLPRGVLFPVVQGGLVPGKRRRQQETLSSTYDIQRRSEHLRYIQRTSSSPLRGWSGYSPNFREDENGAQEVKGLAHTAKQWPSWDTDPDSLPPKSMVLQHYAMALLSANKNIPKRRGGGTGVSYTWHRLASRASAVGAGSGLSKARGWRAGPA